MPDIGLIGVGLVGSALAQRFASEGLSVIGFDPRPEALRALAQLGGMAAPSVTSAAREANMVVLSLPDSDHVEQVVREIEQELKGKLILDTTTGDPDRTAELGKRLAGQGTRYVDATILGSSRQVRDGTVVVMAGGETDAVRECESLFRLFAPSWFHVGPCGSGSRMKLVVNLVLGLNRAVLAEGLSFARTLGLDPRAALDVLKAGVAYSRVMDTKGEKMLTGDFAPEARLAQHHKDVRLILEAAARSGLDVPLSRVHDELLSRAESLGFAEEDNSSIIRAYGGRP